MKWQKIWMWDQVLILASEIWQTLGDELFFPPHIILGVVKQQDMRNKK
jgi:hypothetical protein